MQECIAMIKWPDNRSTPAENDNKINNLIKSSAMTCFFHFNFDSIGPTHSGIIYKSVIQHIYSAAQEVKDSYNEYSFIYS